VINIILFSNFQVVKNDEYKQFYVKNEERWGVINYIIEHLQKLFKSLNIVFGEVDAAKIVQLANDELKVITNGDLIGCLSDKFLKKNGFDNPKNVFLHLIDSYRITIQNCFRSYLARKKFKRMKVYIQHLEKVQKAFRLHILYERAKKLRGENFSRNYVKFITHIYNIRKNTKLLRITSKRIGRI